MGLPALISCAERCRGNGGALLDSWLAGAVVSALAPYATYIPCLDWTSQTTPSSDDERVSPAELLGRQA